MEKWRYYAVFEPAKEGYGVFFPDVPGCISMGQDYEDAVRNAQEALGLHLWNMEQDGEALPASMMPPFEDMPEGGFVAPVVAYAQLVRDEMENRSVRTNVSLPAWMKRAADAQSINYSSLLQAAIREVLQVPRQSPQAGGGHAGHGH